MSKKGEWIDRDDKPEENAFGALAAFRASLPPGPSAAPAGSAKAGDAAGGSERGPERAVIRLERKGRGGKDATIIEQLGLAPAER